ncbi:hypothetical protein GCM10010315_00140 [Streptomyces luteosporeus]|uniref:Secreted protein n=1 Tax=Streptomyces luteosporeus TaxID=173856 RepID=A0ABP6FXE5_9ACTN
MRWAKGWLEWVFVLMATRLGAGQQANGQATATARRAARTRCGSRGPGAYAQPGPFLSQSDHLTAAGLRVCTRHPL